MKEIKLDILAFGAHPDDVELGCGGTLAKEIHNGKKIGIIDLTRGELGTRGDVNTRDLEAQNASKILLKFMGHPSKRARVRQPPAPRPARGLTLPSVCDV